MDDGIKLIQILFEDGLHSSKRLAFSWSFGSSCWVIMMILASGYRARISFVASNPPIRFIVMSIRTQSG